MLGLVLAAGASDLAADKTPDAADAARVTAVRFWSLGEVTRIAVEVSSEFHFKYERLNNPDRLYFDVFGAPPATARRGMQTIQVNDGLVRQLRVAETQSGVTRIVVDLLQPAALTTSQLSNPDRLMIEVTSKDKPAPQPTPGVSGGRKLSEPVRGPEAAGAGAKASPAPPPSLQTSSAQPSPPQPPVATQRSVAANSTPPAAPVTTRPAPRAPESAPKTEPLVKAAAPKPPVETARVNDPPKLVESAKPAEPSKLSEPGKSGGPSASAPKTIPASANRTALSEKLAEKPAEKLTAEKSNDAAGSARETAEISRPAADKFAPLAAAESRVALPPEPLGIEPPVKRDDIQAVLPAKRGTMGDRSLTRALGLKLGRVVIDPGHGGHDVGTHGPSGYFEKDLSLDVARRLAALVEERMGSDVVLTRTDDTYVGLEERTRIANDRKADLFLSIHANSSSYRAAAGVETYILNFTTSKSAMDLAARENASSDLAIHDLQDLLQKIALRDKIEESQELAASLQTSLSVLSTRSNDAAKNRGVKKAPFVVLIGATMPSVLAEIGFLSNSSDEALLRKPEHRQKIAEALYKGISSYADTLSHLIARQN